MPWSSADATWIARGRDGREGRGRTRERWLKHIFESQEGIFFFLKWSRQMEICPFPLRSHPKIVKGGGEETQTHTRAHTC